MWVDFFKGAVKKDRKESRAFWAEWKSGITIYVPGAGFISSNDAYETTVGERITSVELIGIELADIEFLVQRILEGNYLEKPGVAGKGDAVLFMLVNEALHELSGISDDDVSE